MGQQRITQLLKQLESNQQQDLKNAAEIYTIAQVAVEHLTKPISVTTPNSLRSLPIVSNLTKDQLLQRYGSYNGCRKAAKALGLQFRYTPSWTQLTQAFSYAEVLQQLAQSYLSTYPSANLQGITLQIRLDAPIAT